MRERRTRAERKATVAVRSVRLPLRFMQRSVVPKAAGFLGLFFVAAEQMPEEGYGDGTDHRARRPFLHFASKSALACKHARHARGVAFGAEHRGRALVVSLFWGSYSKFWEQSRNAIVGFRLRGNGACNDLFSLFSPF